MVQAGLSNWIIEISDIQHVWTLQLGCRLGQYGGSVGRPVVSKKEGCWIKLWPYTFMGTQLLYMGTTDPRDPEKKKRVKMING